jgi:DNA-binding GntR family transcriptional regulator
MNFMTTSQTSEVSQGELAYAKLNAAIRNGEFRPGDRLREIDIAKRFDLSRTPVREALRRLEADGIIEHKPRFGAVIRALSHTELVELYEMRLVLERTAAQMAAKHAARAQIDTMTRLNEEMAATDDPMIAAALNQEFHRTIYLSARNRFLLQSARDLSNALILLGPTTLEDEERIADVTAQHQVIVMGIAAGDAEQAGDAAADHLESSLRYRLRTFRE